MTFSRDLARLYAVLMDKHDDLHRAVTLFDCGFDYLNGASNQVLDDGDRQERAAYLLDLYRSEFKKILAELHKEIETINMVGFRSK